MQRDRDFADYQDDGAFYNKRPSMWVEPKGDWGAGAVQLVEIPTDDEIHDNIVAYWTPKRAGESRRQLDFRLSPLLAERRAASADRSRARRRRPASAAAACPGQPCAATRTAGNSSSILPAARWRQMAPRYDVKPVVTVSRGKVANALCHQGRRHRPLARFVRHPGARQGPRQSALLSAARRTRR